MRRYNLRSCSSAPSETPRESQDSGATGEGDSGGEEDSRDDDINLSDGGCTNHTHRSSYQEGKRKKKKNIINIGTWNFRTMLDLGKLHLLLEVLKQNDIGIIGMSEVRWSGEGLFYCGDYTIIYCGKEGGQSVVAIALNKHFATALKSYNTISDRLVMIKLNTKPVTLNIIQAYAPTSASTEEEIENFYNDLQAAKDMIPSREICIVMGDFNAKVGEGEDPECGIGPYGLGERNERGDMLATFCQANELCVTNTLFKQPNRRRYTWVSPDEKIRNQIDYMLIDNAWKSTVLNSKTRPGVDCDTDHMLVTAKLRVKAYRQCKPKPNAKYDTDKFKDPDICKSFETETHNWFLPLLEDWSAIWKNVLMNCGLT